MPRPSTDAQAISDSINKLTHAVNESNKTLKAVQQQFYIFAQILNAALDEPNSRTIMSGKDETDDHQA